MKKAALAMASMAMMAMGMAAAVAPVPGISHQTEARAAPAQTPKPVAPQSNRVAIREQRSIGDAVRAMRIPTAHKNRSGGERANRRWRKRRASGRA